MLSKLKIAPMGDTLPISKEVVLAHLPPMVTHLPPLIGVHNTGELSPRVFHVELGNPSNDSNNNDSVKKRTAKSLSAKPSSQKNDVFTSLDHTNSSLCGCLNKLPCSHSGNGGGNAAFSKQMVNVTPIVVSNKYGYPVWINANLSVPSALDIIGLLSMLFKSPMRSPPHNPATQ